MDLIRLLGVAIVEYPIYLCSSKYDYSRFWNKCIKINTLYTKLLQSYAVKYISDDCEYHFNNIPYTKSEIPDIDFITPKSIIGSGMVSIVMEGTDKNGKLCIVKAKRKNIHDKIIKGLTQINNIFQWLKYIPYLNSTFNLNLMYTVFETKMHEQLYFDIEIKNHKKFKQMVSYNENIVVPELYDEYCTDNQIVMSKIEGKHLYNMIPDDGHKYATYLAQMCTKNIVIDGFIHTDLHAGNIIFTNDNKLGIIDFGLMHQIPPQTKSELFTFFKLLVNKEYSKASTLVYNEFIQPEEIKKKLTLRQVQDIKVLFINIYTNAYEINNHVSHKDFYNVIKSLIKYDLQFTTIFHNFMLFIITSELLVKKLSPSPMNIFMDTMTRLYSELNTEDDE
jgi:ubiquinone biosynthesis protein